MANPALNKAAQKAREIVHDNERLRNLLVNVRHKLAETESVSTLVEKAKELINILVRMVKSWLTGQYKELPWRTLFLLVIGLVYFMMPLDLIPDFIPLAGLLDDFSIIIWISNSVKTDIIAFREWEVSQPRKVDEAPADQEQD